MDCVFDGVGWDDVRVVSSEVIFQRVKSKLHVCFQLHYVMLIPLPPDVQNFNMILPVTCSHKLNILQKKIFPTETLSKENIITFITFGYAGLNSL